MLDPNNANKKDKPLENAKTLESNPIHFIILLSAKNTERLLVYAQNLLQFIDCARGSGADCDDALGRPRQFDGLPYVIAGFSHRLCSQYEPP